MARPMAARESLNSLQHGSYQSSPGADPSAVRFQGAIILNPKIFSNIVIDDDTNFSNAITDNKELFNLVKSKVKSNNIILINSKDHLIKALANRQYTKDQIDLFVSRLKPLLLLLYLSNLLGKERIRLTVIFFLNVTVVTVFGKPGEYPSL
jgi:hypothetical protein